MYPYLKLATTLLRSKFHDKIELDDTALLHCRVGLSDIDPFLELNHARQIAYMEMARWNYAARVGFIPLMRERNWGFSVGGISMRYRRRLGLFKRFDVTTRPLCHDGRWLYMLQELVRDGEKCSSALLKVGIVDNAGLVAAPLVLAALQRPDWNPPMPTWVQAWIDAEGERPWPVKPA